MVSGDSSRSWSAGRCLRRARGASRHHLRHVAKRFPAHAHTLDAGTCERLSLVVLGAAAALLLTQGWDLFAFRLRGGAAATAAGSSSSATQRWFVADRTHSRTFDGGSSRGRTPTPHLMRRCRAASRFLADARDNRPPRVAVARAADMDAEARHHIA